MVSFISDRVINIKLKVCFYLNAIKQRKTGKPDSNTDSKNQRQIQTSKRVMLQAL